jgi:hypothetical protein
MEALGKVNSYSCDDCARIQLTLNMHNGTTPFCMGCVACGGSATSNFYRVPRTAQKMVIHQIWYRPIPADFDGMDAETKDHVLNGGLLNAAPGAVRIHPDEVQIDWEYERFQEWCLQTYGVRRKGDE